MENHNVIGALLTQAVESVKKIMEVMVGAEDKLVPIIRRMATGDYNSVRSLTAFWSHFACDQQMLATDSFNTYRHI